MSSFGAKRTARKIMVQEEEDEDVPMQPTSDTSQEPFEQGPALQPTFKTRKPFKQSSLRKSIAVSDEAPLDNQTNPAAGDEHDNNGPVVVRPTLGGRLSSSKSKRHLHVKSKLSFGAATEETAADDDAMVLGHEPPSLTLKRSSGSLATAATEHHAWKKGVMKNSHLPLRSMETDEGRPRYSKEYLSELQNSTPNTPAHTDTDLGDDIEMALDPSELEGATIVEESRPASTPKETHILTEAEITEKKDRRARLARQVKAEEFISLSDDDERGTGDSYLSVLSRHQPETISKTKEKRLVADDNLDDDDSFFVEDGGLSLGKKAEREARRKKRADMANLINAAEGADGSEESDDSEAERRAAYEAAQTRAGMDGLAAEREAQQQRLKREGGVAVPPRITPLPDLSVLVEEFREKMKRKEEEVSRMRARIEELRAEKESIGRREPEVQQLLNEAGERYRALMGGGDAVQNGDSVAAAESLLDRARGTDTPTGRGLDSLGTTPARAEPMEM